jgi:uncharacterized repeat protein (TIGR03843 family)
VDEPDEGAGLTPGSDASQRDDASGPELPPAVDLPPALALPFLRDGDLEIAGRLVQASNTTLLVTVTGDVPGRGVVSAGAVYKPIRGERPLWDFPEATLAHREVAAHAVSEATGWRIVPPTVFRADGPVGPGMLQLWVETRDDVDILDLLQSGDPRLRRIALFDAVVNNADRKGGHLLVRPDGLVQGVDHGVTFNVDPKLRTVLWGWRGTLIAPRELRVLAALRPKLAAGGPLSASLAEHLDAAEIEESRVRLDELLGSGKFPQPHPDWPAVPWPWY